MIEIVWFKKNWIIENNLKNDEKNENWDEKDRNKIIIDKVDFIIL